MKTTKQTQFDVKKLYEQHKTKSNIIRFLDKQGVSRGDISRILNIRYQHVRNVLITPVKNPKQ